MIDLGASGGGELPARPPPAGLILRACIAEPTNAAERGVGKLDLQNTDPSPATKKAIITQAVRYAG
jgi:hypothetical protein